MHSWNARTICDTLRKWFCTYSVPKEISSNGGPPFNFQEYCMFLNNWGIKNTLSAYYPQSNGQAELAIKIAKWILADSTDSYGCRYHYCAGRALLTHHNTPVQYLDMSPALMLRPSSERSSFQDKNWIHKRWSEISWYQEKAMAKRHLRNERCYNTHSLWKIEIGQSVQIQNQTGPY